MMRLSFHGTDQDILNKIRGKLPKIIAALARQIDQNHVMLQSHIVQDKLSGQVLHHRSGKLAASVRIITAQVQGLRITGYVEGAGGPAWYGSLHEFGGIFMAHSRLGKTYEMRIPERSFMRSGLEDMTDFMTTRLQESLDGAIGEKE